MKTEQRQQIKPRTVAQPAKLWEAVNEQVARNKRSKRARRPTTLAGFLHRAILKALDPDLRKKAPKLENRPKPGNPNLN